MPSLGSYLLGAAQLVVLAAGFGLAAFLLRARLLPGWRGAPARLVEIVVAVGLLTVIAEVLGTFHLLYAGALLAAAVLAAFAARIVPARPGEGRRRAAVSSASGPRCVAIAVIAIVVFDWAVTTKHALDSGIFNFDSLWYHMPFSADIAQSHSTTGMHHVETVFVNWFYPQNSELLHAVGILLIGRDTLSLFINFGWLGGRLPRRLLRRPSLRARHPGGARRGDPGRLPHPGRARAGRRQERPDGGGAAARRDRDPGRGLERPARGAAGALRLAAGAAGLAVGLAAGTRLTVFALAGGAQPRRCSSWRPRASAGGRRHGGSSPA